MTFPQNFSKYDQLGLISLYPSTELRLLWSYIGQGVISPSLLPAGCFFWRHTTADHRPGHWNVNRVAGPGALLYESAVKGRLIQQGVLEKIRKPALSGPAASYGL
jgi:hypothetical protein